MKLRMLVLKGLAATCALALSGCATSSGSASVVALKGATLIDGTGAPPTANSIVVISGGAVAAAGPAASVPIPAGARVIDVAGKTVMPGMISNHVADPSRADEMLTQTLKSALALVDVRVLDHLVVAGASMVSFAERGLL